MTIHDHGLNLWIGIPLYIYIYIIIIFWQIYFEKNLKVIHPMFIIAHINERVFLTRSFMFGKSLFSVLREHVEYVKNLMYLLE
jgi:hypothetical protein